ncbi:hypothetical protein H6F98_30580 [Microcoleus sp. FACHB-SPT15]|uniref:hypothetical protein n=1 Tax=Microcoleus sp. FACHB-SPT15 TaxID=2692830 RepID=UPI001781A856|nr:hypothetical protein [Microcoleus sp. FACHB-SPT15]MBD1809763.1 hypothetical protein [Microcoleus sp. FACHB-SPT15]
MDATLQVQFQLFSLSLLLASRQEQQGKLIAPIPVQNEASRGLELYGKHGGSKKLRLSQALAEGSPITAKDLDEMLDFFENTEIDQSNPGWGDNEFPSVDWIRWQLMGGIAGWHWARTTKELASTMGEKL